MAVDYFIYDYEFAEPPRVTSLQNTQPTPTNADFGEDNYFVADQRGFESIIHSIGSSYLSTDGNGKLSDRRILLNKVPADAELLVRFLHLEFFFEELMTASLVCLYQDRKRRTTRSNDFFFLTLKEINVLRKD
jgi:hypothetical protein